MPKKTAQTKKTTGKKADATILKNPRITEKAAHANAASVYVFDVEVSATKSEIAKAFEIAYKHSPLKVRTLIRKPKAYSRKTATRATSGLGKTIKKAYVYLVKGTTVDII
jgi:ribosomal protein L23